MKKLFTFMTLALAVGLCACDDDDNYQWPVPDPVVETLYDMYPSAYRIRWYSAGIYSVAEFRTHSDNTVQSRRAWFDDAGTWYMTETDVTLSQMPQAVQTAYAQSQYAGWEFEDGDRLERAGLQDIYVIEAESPARRDNTAALYYTAAGSLIKTVFNPAGNYHYGDMLPAPLPAPVSAFIQSRYPAAQLISSSVGRDGSQVEILDNGALRTVWFDVNNDWLRTVTAIGREDIPQDVAAAFEQSSYAGYTILGRYYYDTPTGDFYRYELQSGSQTLDIDITSDGTITPAAGH